MRREEEVLQNFDKNAVDVRTEQEKVLVMRRRDGPRTLFCCCNFADEEITVSLPNGAEGMEKVLDSGESQWREPGQPPRQPHAASRAGVTGDLLALAPVSVVVYRVD